MAQQALPIRPFEYDLGGSAQRYAQRGWRVMPLWSVGRQGHCYCPAGETCKTPGKHPRISGWTEKASSNLTTVSQWWGSWKESNIGILTGKANSLVVIEIDPRHNGIASLEKLQEEYGNLPQTLTARSGGGGTHYYFTYPDGIEHVKSVSGVREGIDCRGDGGLIVAAPSNHISGNRYIWIVPSDTPLVPLPGFLLPLIAQAHQRTSSIPHNEDETIPQGSRNATLTSHGGRLRRMGYSEFEIEQALKIINQSRCVPPLDDDEVEKIAASVAMLLPPTSPWSRQTMRQRSRQYSSQSHQSSLQQTISFSIRIRQMTMGTQRQ